MSPGLCWVALVVAAGVLAVEAGLMVRRYTRHGRHSLRTGRTWPPRRTGDDR